MEDALKPVTDWLRSRNPEAGAIPADLDLIENRLIDSLGFMEFILLLEDLAGREFPVAELDVDCFRTLRAVHDNFLSATAPSVPQHTP
ncbi:acyl carrier protein [Streptomyces sp. NBC_01142]|uniref:acyl carrier protein n=1 Tax=Streptomyces sp. NBC_01142 TaxID=2975865 RepID=UPI002258FBAE|nr:acyl carrier protein [Streptomyces sp. NBC_01142]MCX4825184.1 acyl carrier protein [Streptomyces sp. NBC_01142]